MQFKKLLTGRRGGTLIGTAVLVTVLGAGGAVAAGMVTSQQILDHTIRSVDLGYSSVGSNSIRDTSIRNQDLRDASVGSNSIRDGSIRRDDLRFEVRDGATGAAGPKGESGAPGPKGEIGDQGPKGEVGAVGPQGEIGPAGRDGAKGDTGALGPAGPAGAAGTSGVSGYQRVTAQVLLNAGSREVLGAACPAGKVVVGGGHSLAQTSDNVVHASYPSSDNTWTVNIENTENFDDTSLTVWAVCLDVPVD